MNWWQLLLMWLGGWMLIIVLNIINNATRQPKGHIELVEKELVSDGNNLFKTGFMYFIPNILFHFINIPILHWLIMIIEIIFCIPPLISIIGVVKSVLFWKGNYWFALISAIICDLIPLLMALNIYLIYIK